MTINFVNLMYKPAYDLFARPVTITPTKSQPGQPAYVARGKFDTAPFDIETEDAGILSDATTILDIIETEFTVLPLQGDTILIGATGDLPALGEFEVIDSDTNGIGETTLSLRRLVTATP